MFFELSEEKGITKDSVRKYALERIAPVQEEDERDGIFRREIISEMGKLGFGGGVIPEEYGGTDRGFLSSVLIVEEIAKVSASYTSHNVSQTVGPGLTILKYGAMNSVSKAQTAIRDWGICNPGFCTIPTWKRNTKGFLVFSSR